MSFHSKQTHTYLHSRLPFPMRSDTFSLFLAVFEAWWAQWERKWNDGTNKEKSGPGRARAKSKPEGERENAGEHWVLPAGFPCERGLNDNGAHQGPSTTQSHGSARNTGTHSMLLHIHTHAAQIYKHWFNCLPYLLHLNWLWCKCQKSDCTRTNVRN